MSRGRRRPSVAGMDTSPRGSRRSSHQWSSRAAPCRCWERRPHQGPPSYSRGNLVLANVGNAVYSVYVFTLPAGPIWLLHTFYILSSALMLIWSLRYGRRPSPAEDPCGH